MKPIATRWPLVAAFLIAGVAAAQSAQPQPKPASEASPSPTQPKAVKVGKTVYDFDEVDILGKLKKPEVAPIVEPPEFRFRRLLDLDESFLPNIVRSVDEF
jgi:hypothetical protein